MYLFNGMLEQTSAQGIDGGLTQTNKEVYDILVESLRSEIHHLKEEINFLRVIVRS